MSARSVPNRYDLPTLDERGLRQRHAQWPQPNGRAEASAEEVSGFEKLCSREVVCWLVASHVSRLQPDASCLLSSSHGDVDWWSLVRFDGVEVTRCALRAICRDSHVRAAWC